MLKYLLILLTLTATLSGKIYIGDKYIDEQNYVKSLKDYEKSFTSGRIDVANIKKIVQGYINLGDSYYNIQGYKKAKKYYNEALKFHSNLAKYKLAQVYEKEGDLYLKGKRYTHAYLSYKESNKLGNRAVKSKIKKVAKYLVHKKTLKSDTRKVVSKDAPKWTQAIGRLIVPVTLKKQHDQLTKQVQKCSATLVNFDDSASSKVIVTASHCITHYDKNAGTMRFVINNKEGKVIQKFAEIYMDSIYDKDKLQINSDYAVLILSSEISKKDVKPLLVPDKSFIDMTKEYEHSFASLGGFSSDVGSYGSQLSYDPKCKIQNYSSTYAKSTCKGYKGASGGPVVFNGSYDKRKYDNYFVGVVSHFKNGKYNQIFFSPHHIFYNYLESAIQQYNY